MLALMMTGWLLGCSSDTEPGAKDDVDEVVVPVAGLRRLTVHEYDLTLRDVLLDDTRPGRALLPADALQPFDNDWTTQNASLALVEAVESLAGDVAERFVDDGDRMAAVLPCTGAGPDDTACLTDVVETVGRRLLRRPLSPEEVGVFVDLGALEAASEDAFDAGVAIVLRAFLQDPAFLYRVEIGTPIPGSPGLHGLDGYEVASRLSYLLWGSAPDDALLDAAGAGELDTSAGIRSQAERMLGDDRARDQVDRFHALWLGYHELPHEAWLTDAMRAESRALVEHLVFDEPGSWLDVLTWPESYIDQGLADHYGVSGPGGTEAGWVQADPDRAGLLGTGAFLSVGSGVADTSPTRRGKFIQERLRCLVIPPPPPGVDADEPPSEELGECKVDRYAQHRLDPACASCHDQMDPVGFGLENYNREGQWRDHDDGNPDCVISGEGELVGVGTFAGPTALAQLIEPEIDACVVQQVFHHAMGKLPDTADQPLMDGLTGAFQASGHRFDLLLLELVSDPGFGFRREEGS